MLQTVFGASCMNRASVFEWHKRIKEGRKYVRDDEKCVLSIKVAIRKKSGNLFNDPRIFYI